MKTSPTLLRIALVSFAALTTHVTIAQSPVLARIGSNEITVEDVRASLGGLDPREQAALNSNPALASQVVRSLLVQRIVLKEAADKQWEKRPEVAAELARAREKALVESYVNSIAQPPAEYPSEGEIKAAYDASKPALLVPKQMKLAQIFVAVAKDAEKATQEKAQAKLDAIRKNLKAKEADFAAIARKESEEKASADRGGEIGWLTENQIQPEIRQRILDLAAGSISEPIRLNDGWHIIKVAEIKEAYTPALPEVRELLARQMRAEKARANSQAYLAKLLQENPVAVNELALSQILPKAEKN